MKKLISLFAVTFLVLWTATGYSKIDVGLDFSQSYTAAADLDLRQDDNNHVATRSTITDTRGNHSGDTPSWAHSLLGLNVSASTTGMGGGEVAFFGRVVSQFDWLGAQTGTDSNSVTGSTGSSGNSALGGTNPLGFSINQLYAKFHDFAGLPVDITVGRQNISFGRGLIVADRRIGGGTAFYANGFAPTGSAITFGQGQTGQQNAAHVGGLPVDPSSAGVYHDALQSDFTGFDALRLDFKWKEFYSNIGWALVSGAFVNASTRTGAAVTTVARDIGAEDNETLFFANFGYTSRKWLNHPWNVELYYVKNTDNEPVQDAQPGAFAGLGGELPQIAANIHTYGGRFGVELQRVIGLKAFDIFGEYAIQTGGSLGGHSDPTKAFGERGRDAHMLNAGLGAKFSHKYSPRLGLEYVLFSGPKANEVEDDDTLADVAKTTNWSAWDPVMRKGNAWTMIIDSMDVFYLTDTLAPEQTDAGIQGKVDSPITNRQMVVVTAGISPARKWDVDATFAVAYFASDPFQAAGVVKANNRRHDDKVGSEIDVNVTYEFSKSIDVSLAAAQFQAGDYYKVPGDVITGKNADNPWLVRLGFDVSF